MGGFAYLLVGVFGLLIGTWLAHAFISLAGNRRWAEIVYSVLGASCWLSFAYFLSFADDASKSKLYM